MTLGELLKFVDSYTLIMVFDDNIKKQIWQGHSNDTDIKQELLCRNIVIIEALEMGILGVNL